MASPLRTLHERIRVAAAGKKRGSVLRMQVLADRDGIREHLRWINLASFRPTASGLRAIVGFIRSAHPKHTDFLYVMRVTRHNAAQFGEQPFEVTDVLRQIAE